MQAFKKHGLYRILYHNSVIQGVDDTGILGQLLKNGFIGIGISTLAIILFATSVLLGAPVWVVVIANAFFAAAATYLAALVYGVVNDLFATKGNLPYFLLGHQQLQNSLLRTNDPVAQGIAWGVAATFGPAVLASIVFGIGTAITASLVPVASFAFPLMLVAMPLIAWGANTYAKGQAKKYVQAGLYGHDLDSIQLGSNYYQVLGLSVMSNSKADKAAWLANSDRNLFGFTKVPLIGLSALTVICFLSAIHNYLPTILFSVAVSTVMPAAAALAAVSFLTISGIYTYVNRNKQIDNRYKLSFDPTAKLEHELYLDEDLNLVEEFSKDYNPRTDVLDMPQEPRHFSSPLDKIVPSTQNIDSSLQTANKVRL